MCIRLEKGRWFELMTILPIQADPFILAPIAFTVLTIFGRKGKKEEKGAPEKPEKTPTVEEPVRQTPSQTDSSPSALPSDNTAVNPEVSSSSDETSLNKLLQSLLQDMPFNPPPESESNDASLQSTTDWIPPRATPPSRPMIIVPGEKREKVLAPVEREEPSIFTRKVQAPEPEPNPPTQAARPSAPPGQKAEQMEQEVKKPSKTEKPERQEAKQQGSGTPAKKSQNFERIFDLTQGALRAPGLVIINGQLGSGKTSLASNLAGAYLKTGSPCLLVTYDQSVASLRDSIKKTGWDAVQYESQFRLVIVDGFASQSDSLSLEPYYVEKPFDLDSVTETLVRNSQVFMGSNVRIILDSLTGIGTRIPQKEFLAKFRDLLNKMKESGATFITTVDESKLSKDVIGPYEDMATCVIELQRGGQNSGQLKVRKLNGSASKSEPESFEIEPGKGLLFV